MGLSGETTPSIISRGIGKRKEKGMADVFEKAKAEEKKPIYRCWAKDCKHFGSWTRYHRDTNEPYHLCEYHQTVGCAEGGNAVFQD